MDYTIKRTEEFSLWLKSLKDVLTRQRLAKRLHKAQRGHLGDIASVGNGVYEMREHFGPGWRMYYLKKGSALLLMLGGGDKSTQQTDIAKAIRLGKTTKE